MEDMSLGMGIFLSALALGLVFLIIKTKDRWKWGRILAVVIGLPALIVAGLVGYEYYKSLPKKTTEFMDIRLGMPMADVRFVKGEPYTDEITEKGNRVLLYRLEEAFLVVVSREGYITQVHVDGSSAYSSSLYGVWLGATLTRVRDRFGVPDKVREVNETTRSYYWQKYNLMATIDSGKVISLGIMNDFD